MTAADAPRPAAPPPRSRRAGSSRRSRASLANDHVDFDLRRGRGPRAPRRERRRQEHADEHPRRAVPAGRGRGPGRRRGRSRSARRATRSRPGIGMVHQHFTLVPSQTVTENILLGLDGRGSCSHARAGPRPRSRALAERRSGCASTRGPAIWQLSVGEQQRVEILKMLYRGARILIMDEPTAVLAPQEVEELFATLRSMAADGPERRLHQPQARRGARDRRPDHGHARAAGSPRPGSPPAGATEADLARLMVGRTRARDRSSGPPVEPGAVVLAVRGVAADERPRAAGAARRVARGPGRRDRRHRRGRRQRPERARRGHHRPAAVHRARSAIGGAGRRTGRAGAAIERGRRATCPEDRTGVGSAPNLSLVDNLIMKRYRDAPVARGWLIDDGAARDVADGLLEDATRIAAPDDRHAGPAPVRRQPPAR